MTFLRPLLIVGCLAGSIALTASPAGAVGGMKARCPGWFQVKAYEYCVGRPASLARHHYYHRYHHRYYYRHHYRRHRGHVVVRTKG